MCNMRALRNPFVIPWTPLSWPIPYVQRIVQSNLTTPLKEGEQE